MDEVLQVFFEMEGSWLRLSFMNLPHDASQQNNTEKDKQVGADAPPLAAMQLDRHRILLTLRPIPEAGRQSLFVHKKCLSAFPNFNKKGCYIYLLSYRDLSLENGRLSFLSFV